MTKKQKRSCRSYKEKQKGFSYFQWDSDRKARVKEARKKKHDPE